MKLNKIHIRSQNRTYLEHKLKCLFKKKRAPRGAFEFHYLYFERFWYIQMWTIAFNIIEFPSFGSLTEMTELNYTELKLELDIL